MSPPLHQLLRTLDAEVQVLKLLQYRHQVCALLLSVADHRHLTMAADELERAEEQVAEADLARAVAADSLAEFWDLQYEPVTMSLLLTRADEQEAELLIDRQEQLKTSMEQLEELKGLAHQLASASLGEVQSRVTVMQSDSEPKPLTYDSTPQELRASVQLRA
jgi:hypothetical protein